MNDLVTSTQLEDPLARFLETCSVEVVSNDQTSIDLAGALLRPGTEVFIANLPKHKAGKLIDAAIALRRSGLVPVPHFVARNIADRAELLTLLGGLTQHAGVDTALVIGGDRDRSIGSFDDSLQLLETGLFEQLGMRKIYIAGYPEGHARISHEKVISALSGKLTSAKDRGLAVTLISQFCFDSRPIIAWLQSLRADGVHVPYRVGVAGPTSKAALIRYALLCGVGPSLRALKERDNLARNMLTGETPEVLLRDVAMAQRKSPELNIAGAHFFPFGSLARTAEWIASLAESSAAA